MNIGVTSMLFKTRLDSQIFQQLVTCLSWLWHNVPLWKLLQILPLIVNHGSFPNLGSSILGWQSLFTFLGLPSLTLASLNSLVWNFSRGWLTCFFFTSNGVVVFSLSQWLNFKRSGITCLVGKIKFKLFISGSIGWVSFYDGWILSKKQKE